MSETERSTAGRPSDAGAARPGLPVLPPWMALTEIMVLLVIPGALDYFWEGFPSLSETQPHFFWLAVLLLSLQYGTVSGLLAAGVAIAFSALLGWPDQEVGENHFSYLLRIWTQPVLWLAAALVLGQFRMRQIEQKQGLATELATLDSQRKAIAEHATNLRARCEALERELAGRREPKARALLAALGALTSGTADAERRLGNCLEIAFGPCRASVWVVEPDRLRRIAQHGAGARDEGSATIAAAEPIYASLVGDGRALSMLAPGDEAALGQAGLAAVPVRAAAGGAIVGALVLEAAEPAELDGALLVRLGVIASQLAPLVEPGGIEGRASARVAEDVAAAPVAAAAAPRLWRQIKWRRSRQGEAPPRQRTTRAG